MNVYIEFTSRQARDFFTSQGVKIIETKENKYSRRFTAVCSGDEALITQKIIKRYGKRVVIYPENEKRSSDYRAAFFRENPGPYRCRYCNRKLKKYEVTVDHVIAVNKAKTEKRFRNLLEKKGYSGVNDVRNLAPACMRCNRRKAEKAGIWLLRAWLGKYRIYWIVKPVVTAFIIAAIGYAAWKTGWIDRIQAEASGVYGTLISLWRMK